MSSPCGSRRQSSAFQWPIPASSASNDIAEPESPTDISVKEILDRYQNDPDIMKQVLAAKAAEDKKRTARDGLLIELARIQQRRIDLELAREQIKSTYRTPAPLHAPLSSSVNLSSSIGYHGLAPLQQQVIARITGSAETNQIPAKTQNSARPPPSPYYYPHSAHPLCPTTTAAGGGGNDCVVSPRPHYYSYAPQQSSSHLLRPPSNTQRKQQLSPISPAAAAPTVSADEEDPSLKQTRSCYSKQSELLHDRVMEALKAKIKRGSSSHNNGTPKTHRDKQKRQRTTKNPSDADNSSSTPKSAGSNKPVLPPIDTSVGRIQHHPASPSPVDNSTSPESSIRSPLPRRPFPTSSPSDHLLSTDRRYRRHRSSSPLDAPRQNPHLIQSAENTATVASNP
ncbi:hypothetical protein EC973_005310 [Apophysomyces ossiformis]|uniref:Uncharacterized protein n=1 Tax=Apophysomyces ossiformis TaxID=679940 RepID=A0A8H7ESW9_9FUNG|nr:hypothetical protein EC973_005310 [Apophysomyces ossiformis]